jgi:hypothetical protein
MPAVADVSNLDSPASWDYQEDAATLAYAVPQR